MSKKTLILLLFVLLASLAFAQETSKDILTVMDFRTSSISGTEMRSIVNLLSHALYRTGKYKIIDSSQRDTLLSEIDFSFKDCSDESCQIEAGKLLAADFIVVGELEKTGSRLTFSCKLLETGTGALHGSDAGLYQNLDDLLNNLWIVASRLSGTKYQEPAELRKKADPKKALGITASIAGYTAAAGGITMLAILPLLQRKADIARRDYEDLPDSAPASEFDSAYDAYTLAAYKMKALAGGGIALTSVGFVGGLASTIVTAVYSKKQNSLSFLLGPAYAGIKLSF